MIKFIGRRNYNVPYNSRPRYTYNLLSQSRQVFRQLKYLRVAVARKSRVSDDRQEGSQLHPPHDQLSTLVVVLTPFPAFFQRLGLQQFRRRVIYDGNHVIQRRCERRDRGETLKADPTARRRGTVITWRSQRVQRDVPDLKLAADGTRQQERIPDDAVREHCRYDHLERVPRRGQRK